MERTLVVVGLFLSLLGLIVAFDGYTYVNVDRGPPLMICGVLVFCAGLVLAALGFVLHELQAISADASKAALLLANARVPAAPVSGDGPSASFEAPQAVGAPAELKPFEQWSQQPSAPPVAAQVAAPAPDLGGAVARPFAPPGPAFEGPKLIKTEEPPPLAPPLSPPLSWMIRSEISEPITAKPDIKPDTEDWRNKPHASDADEAAIPEPKVEPAAQEAERALAQEFGFDDELGLDKEFGSPKDGGIAKELGLTETKKPTDDQEATKPEVIGHYEAHGAHYTMYADGSIEAETQHGVYRFANIDELKRFIEGET